MWISVADVEARYGAAEVDRLADLDGDGVRDAGVAEAAVAAAEDRARGLLLTRYKPGDLPATPDDVSDNLRRILVDLAWWELHKRAAIHNEGARTIGTEALADLRTIVAGAAALVLDDEPAVDVSRPVIVTSAPRCADDRMTLENRRYDDRFYRGDGGLW